MSYSAAIAKDRLKNMRPSAKPLSGSLISHLRVTTLDRYLLTQLTLTITFGVLLFSIIWLAPETLFKLIQYIFAGKVTVFQALKMLLYHLPATLQQSIPMAVLFGSIFLFRRLSLQYELITFFSSGISPRRLLAPVLLVGAAFSLLHWTVQEVWTPVANPQLTTMYQRQQLKAVEDSNFAFVERNQRGQMDKFFLIGQTQNFEHSGRLSDFIILYYQPSTQGGVQISRILRAPTGHWNPHTHAWQLLDGMDYELNNDGVYQEIHRFREQWVNTSKYPFQLLHYSAKNPMSLGWGSLADYLRLLKEGGQLQDVPFYEVRLFQKIALPAASMVLVILGALLGMEHPRSQHQYSLVFGAIVMFCYSVLVPFTTNLGRLGFFPPFLVAWVPLGVACGAALLILQWRKQLTN